MEQLISIPHQKYLRQSVYMGSSGGTVAENLPANTGDAGAQSSVTGLERSPGGRNGNPLQYNCLENALDRRG